MTYLKPKDIIAIIVLMSYVFLIFNGYDGPLNDMIGIIIGFYFGLRKNGHDSGH